MTPINEAKHFKIKSLVGNALLTDAADNPLGTIQVKSGLSLIKTRIPCIFEEDDEGEIYIYRKGGGALKDGSECLAVFYIDPLEGKKSFS